MYFYILIKAYSKHWHRRVHVDHWLHGCQHVTGRIKLKPCGILTCWIWEMCSRQRLWWSLIPVCVGETRSLLNAYELRIHGAEQLCTSLRTSSPRTYCVDAVIYKVWMREWVMLNILSSSVGYPWSKNTAVCWLSHSLSLSSSLSCMPLHSRSLAGNNCLSSTQHFK